MSVSATILLAGLVGASAAAAQQTQSKNAPAPSAIGALEARATQPNMDAGQWVQVGDAFMQAAQLRAPSDARALDDLLGAAQAYRIAGKLTLARRSALAAGQRALLQDEGERAARAYLAAAKLSLELRDEASANSYFERAGRLAQSARMSPEQKREILAQQVRAPLPDR